MPGIVNTGEFKEFQGTTHIFQSLEDSIASLVCEANLDRANGHNPAFVAEGGSGVETAECWLHQGAASDSLPPHQIWQPSNCNYI